MRSSCLGPQHGSRDMMSISLIGDNHLSSCYALVRADLDFSMEIVPCQLSPMCYIDVVCCL